MAVKRLALLVCAGAALTFAALALSASSSTGPTFAAAQRYSTGAG